MNSILLIFFCVWINMASFFKKNEVNLELLTDIDMLTMVEKRIRGVILCQATHRYAKGNNNT